MLGNNESEINPELTGISHLSFEYVKHQPENFRFVSLDYHESLPKK
jgi:hypothetical protein